MLVSFLVSEVCFRVFCRLLKQVHRGIKGVVEDTNGNRIKGATISVRGVRKDVTTGMKQSKRCILTLSVTISDHLNSALFATLVTHQLCCLALWLLFHLLSAEDGDYWRLLNPGTHILTATAKGYSRVSKRVYLPHNMNKAGRVDFVLEKVGLLPSVLFPNHGCAIYSVYFNLFFCVRGSVFLAKGQTSTQCLIHVAQHSKAQQLNSLYSEDPIESFNLL